MDILAFQGLAAAAFPTLNISVNQDMQVTATRTVLTYTITARGAKLPADVVVQSDSPAEAVRRLSPAIAKVRRAHETQKVLAELEGEWTEIERAGMQQRLLQVYGKSGFDLVAAEIRRQDKHRYDCGMHEHYENTGEYETAA